jgi:hypothetical protein
LQSAGKDDVQIIFSDDGCGMNPEVRRNAFDPFFTMRAIRDAPASAFISSTRDLHTALQRKACDLVMPDFMRIWRCDRLAKGIGHSGSGGHTDVHASLSGGGRSRAARHGDRALVGMAGLG